MSFYRPVSTGDGSFKLVPEKPLCEFSLHQAAKVLKMPYQTLYENLRLYPWILNVRRSSPMRLKVSAESVYAMRQATADPDYWPAQARRAKEEAKVIKRARK